MDRNGAQGEMRKIIKPRTPSPAPWGCQSLLIGQKGLEAESVYFFKVIQTQARHRTVNIGLRLVPLTLMCDRSSFPGDLNQTISTYCESPKLDAFTAEAKATTVRVQI